MAMKGVYKLDEGNYYPTNCFPARNLLQPRYEEGAGHWQVARQMVDKVKIEWLLSTRAGQLRWKEPSNQATSQKAEKILNKAQLIKLHNVKQPSDLCSVNISHQNFSLAEEDEFQEFDSVAYINATENLLTLDIFRKFPVLRELDLSLNALRNLKICVGDFPHLEILDLSYNNLSPKDVKLLGILPHLKALHLTANGLTSLPLDLVNSDRKGCLRFQALEVLLLDDNHLSHPNVFVSLASLRSLKQLNLDRNGIKEVPYLHHIDNTRFSIHPLSAKSGIQAGLHSRRKAAKQRHRVQSPKLAEDSSYIIVQNLKDPDRTEVIFPAKSSETQESSLSHADQEASKPDVNAEFILPLPELRFLSLANNQVTRIEHEEELLAVALFPSLLELTFYGNPFLSARSGDPPLLTSFLQNKLGIQLVRKKISKLKKPRIFIPIKANRKVKSQLPKIQKRPVLETTFWQLWTASDLDHYERLSLSEHGCLSSIRSDSLPSDLERPILHLLKSDERSFSLSMTSTESTSSSEDELLSRILPLSQPSRDQFLPRLGLLTEFSLEWILSESSQLESVSSLEQSYIGSAAPTGLPPTEEFLPEPPSPFEAVSETSRTPSAGQLIQTELEGIPPPTSPSEGQDLSEHVPVVGLEEQDLPKTLSTTSSLGEQIQSVMSLSSEQTEPKVSVDSVVGKSLSSIREISIEKNLEEDFPPSPTAEQDEEARLRARSSTSGSSSSTLLPGSFMSTFSFGEDTDQEGAPLRPTVGLQELHLSASAEAREQPIASTPSFSARTEEEELLLPSKSIPSELTQLIAQAEVYARSMETEEDFFQEEEEEEEELRSSREDVEDKRLEPIFITQEAEPPDSYLSLVKEGVTQAVPKQYKGYEELLGGDPGADFVEPVGIQQNVQALEKALRYPLVYRDAKARLDRCHNPYVPAKKKVLRVPAPKVQKTRMERLEELLLELRKPYNIVHVPLVCILRRRKKNWHEYREALELLKEFQQTFKSTVAACVTERTVQQSDALKTLLRTKVSRLSGD